MEAASSNAALMRRIVQLENERDDLRKDVETLCMQQSGQHSGGNDFMSRLQARRLAGLEQELESFRQKVSLYKRENDNLQDELSEVYHIKGQVSDLYKTEMEKNKKLEEELKFFQTKVAASLAERDKLYVEIDRMHSHEETIENELKEYHQKHRQAMREKEETMSLLNETQAKLNQMTSEMEVYHQVIKKFWQLRRLNCTEETTQDIEGLHAAECLLSDPDNSWAFGDAAQVNTKLQETIQCLEAAKVAAEKELAALKAEATELLRKADVETKAREEAVCRTSALEANLLEVESTFRNKLQELREHQASLRDHTYVVFQGETKFFEATMLSFQEFVEKLKTEESSVSATGSRTISDSSDTATSNEGQASKGNQVPQTVVTQDAFLQALHEKVAALMLLSQEEERHILEGKTTGAMECQIKELNQKLQQVTLEKVEALMQVAHLKYECQELKDRERELMNLLQNPSSASGRLLPASWTGNAEPVAEQSTEIATFKQNKKKHTSTGSYLKSWLRGGDLYGFICSQAEAPSTSTPIDIARTKVESAALQERITSLQQLIKSAKRLQGTLSSIDAQSAASNLRLVNGVYAEAQRLKVALNCTLPVSWSGEADSLGEDSTPQTDEKSVLELVSAAGMTLVELLLTTAELQRASLSSAANEVLCLFTLYVSQSCLN